MSVVSDFALLYPENGLCSGESTTDWEKRRRIQTKNRTQPQESRTATEARQTIHRTRVKFEEVKISKFMFCGLQSKNKVFSKLAFFVDLLRGTIA